MGKTLLFLMLMWVKLAFGQISDDFSDGDFTKNPTWIGDVTAFHINSSKQLKTTLAAVGQSVALVMPSSFSLNAKWEFDLEMNFDPSATNQARIYLIADQADTKAPLNGYFLQVGETGSSDSYDLYRQNGNVLTKIIDGPPQPRFSANRLFAKLRITRNALGNWELFTDVAGTGNFNLEGSAVDLTFTNCSYFGINCKYTSTRSDGFMFDNFKITELIVDVTPPKLVQAAIVDNFNLEATFSEALDPALAVVTSNYNLSHMGTPVEVSATNKPHVFKLQYATAFPSGDFTLKVENVKDLKGNAIGKDEVVSFSYVRPYELQANDIQISEVLANPKTGGVDFIEIYNPKSITIDIKGLVLANVDADGKVANLKQISASSLLLPAQTYWVLTTAPEVIKAQYVVNHPSQFIQLNALPSYNNDKGTVVLLNASNTIIDQFSYTAAMHLPLLQNVDGVSLERVSFLRAANDEGNFTSAAMTSGFATPTAKNSQEEHLLALKNNVSLSQKSFSPDGDGTDDELQIDYQLLKNGNFATVNIYNEKGALVRKLQKNVSLATAGQFTWDGNTDAGQKSKVGIYIVNFDVFDLSGKTQRFRKICVLAAKLN